MPLININGHGRHGKDTFADILSEMFGIVKPDASMIMARIIADDPGGFMPGMSVEAIYHSRHQFRAKWYEYFREYTALDPSRLVRAILSEGDIYVGHRSKVEFSSTITIWDIPPIWVEREGFPLEPTMELSANDHEIIIQNNSIKSMRIQAIGLGLRYGWKRLK